MNVWLEDADGRRLPVSGNCLLGRMPDCSIVLSGTQISRRHALILSPDEAQFLIVDLGSTNGVHVRGHRVRQNCVLHDGDDLRIGEHRFVFHARQPPGSPPSPMASWVKTARADAELTSIGYGIIVTDARGVPQCITERAREWLAVYFPAAQAEALPDDVKRWLRRMIESPAGPAAPLIVQQATKQLLVRVAERTGKDIILMLTEEGPASVKRLVEGLGLTKREGEVLRWLVEGKSNAIIAGILGISNATAAKHVQHVFMKLGVENRSAAIRTVMELLGRTAP